LGKSFIKVALFLPNLEGGGAERTFVELANRFVLLGPAVDLVLVRAEGSYLEEVDPEVRLVDLRETRTLFSLLKLHQYIRNKRPDVVISGLDTPNIVNWIACWLAGMPNAAVLTQRSVLTAAWKQSHAFFSWAWIPLIGLVYRRARLVIGNSRGVINDLRRNLGVLAERSTVIPNSVDSLAITRLAKEPLDHAWASDVTTPLILMVASLSKLKDIPTALRAFARLRSVRNCRMVVLGEGSERRKLQELIRELGIYDCVHLLGFDRNPFRWMARAKVLVSSSPSEGCPNVILQALACGLQVVATNGLGGTSEILENGRWGRLVPVGDDQLMADAIADAIDKPLSVDVRTRASMFDPDRTAKAYLRLLLPESQVETWGGS